MGCRRLEQSEHLVRSIEKAWAIHLPNLSLKDALQQLGLKEEAQSVHLLDTPSSPAEASRHEALTRQTSKPSPADLSNVEDFEFDESQEFDNTTDGMGFLVVEPGKAGYMGPQSGVAALKFLQSLHLSMPVNSTSPLSLDEPDAPGIPQASSSDIRRYLDDYFSIYHTAYPILHEATFRARVFGTPLRSMRRDRQD